jgi:ParB family chromosome partitioning protein
MNTNKSHGLGRGLGTLIPQDFDNSLLLDSTERVQKILLTQLTPNADQPRQHFDEDALQELADSIKQHGILLPLVATKLKDNTFRIIAGERRWRAAKLAGLKSAPVIVRTMKELEQLEIALVENVQRVDLAPLEQAASIERLHQQFNVSYEEISQRLGKAFSTISNIVRLLGLPAEAQAALRNSEITEGHARAILSLRNTPEEQLQLLHLVVKNGWSVRQAERFASAVKSGVEQEAVVKQHVNTQTPLTHSLSDRFTAPVQIRRMAKGGRLEISFKNDEDLERIVKQLM